MAARIERSSMTIIGLRPIQAGTSSAPTGLHSIAKSYKIVKGEYKNPVKGQVQGPKQVYEVFKAIKDKHQETLIGVYLDADLKVNSYDTLSLGSRSSTLVDASEIFGRAFVLKSKYLILIHNHPKGNPEPSPTDREMMRKLIQQSRIMKLHFLDFIIVGDDKYWSMFEEMDGGSYTDGAWY